MTCSEIIAIQLARMKTQTLSASYCFTTSRAKNCADINLYTVCFHSFTYDTISSACYTGMELFGLNSIFPAFDFAVDFVFLALLALLLVDNFSAFASFTDLATFAMGSF
jgi:hypothetical protein